VGRCSYTEVDGRFYETGAEDLTRPVVARFEHLNSLIFLSYFLLSIEGQRYDRNWLRLLLLFLFFIIVKIGKKYHCIYIVEF